MADLLGLLRIRVKRGVNLAIRDLRSSDPYVVVKLAKHGEDICGDGPCAQVTTQQQRPQVTTWALNTDFVKEFHVFSTRTLHLQKLKTRVIKKNVNPEWNEELTFPVTDPNIPLKLSVYDHDTFTRDDKMGDAEVDIRQFAEALKMKFEGLPSGTVISRIQPTRQNDVAEESSIVWTNGKVEQDLCLRLKNVECGELEIQLKWDLPGSKG